MMGRLNHDQEQFFYSFRLDEAVPQDHPVREVAADRVILRSEEHTSELQSHLNLVCRLLLEKKKKNQQVHAKMQIGDRLFDGTQESSRIHTFIYRRAIISRIRSEHVEMGATRTTCIMRTHGN